MTLFLIEVSQVMKYLIGNYLKTILNKSKEPQVIIEPSDLIALCSSTIKDGMGCVIQYILYFINAVSPMQFKV